MFYGLIVSMYFMDNKEHKRPHIHISYQGKEAVFSIPEGEVLSGNLPRKQTRLAQAWIEIHADELVANWELAIAGQPLYKIEPLK